MLLLKICYTVLSIKYTLRRCSSFIVLSGKRATCGQSLYANINLYVYLYLHSLIIIIIVSIKTFIIFYKKRLNKRLRPFKIYI